LESDDQNQFGLDYDLESDEELAELQGEDCEAEDGQKSDGSESEDSCVEEGFIIADEDCECGSDQD
jgi:hypothetical protein